MARFYLAALPSCSIVLCASLLTSEYSAGCLAGEWPQILGPHRNGFADAETLAEQWPADGPALVWKRDVGRGHAGVAVRDGRVVLFHRVGDQEVVEMLDAVSGRQIWRTQFPAHYRGQIFPDEDGPLCVPLMHGDRVFLCGAGGDVHAVSLADGKTLWSRPLYRELRQRGGQIDYGYFGAGSCPIVDGDQLLINIGGFSDAGLVALSLTDGKTRWQATDELPSYSSPVAVTINGDRHVVFVTRYNVVSIDPAKGDVRFRFPFGRRGPTVNAATPVVVGKQLFVTASYGVGAVMAQIDGEGVQQVWANDESLSSHYHTSIHHDGYLYGVDGRADVGIASLRCVDLATGKVAWSQQDFGVASLMHADDKLLIMKADGQLVLARPSPRAFKPVASARLFDGAVRALPALAQGKLFVRDQATLKCFDLRRRDARE